MSPKRNRSRVHSAKASCKAERNVRTSARFDLFEREDKTPRNSAISA